MSKDFLNSTDSARSARPLRHARTLTLEEPLALELGGRLQRVAVCYETYGRLDPDGGNAVLVCHALSGDSHVARHDAQDDPGWWDVIVGPGLPLDTERCFVVCANVLGGCRGTTGPNSPDPATGRPYGRGFPHHHHRRHGGGPAAAAGPARHPAAARRDRRLHGRAAGAGVGAPLPGLRRRLHPRGHRGPAHLPGAGLRHRGAQRHPAQPGKRAGHRPHDRPHHLPVPRVDAAQVRGGPHQPPRRAHRVREALLRRLLPRLPGRPLRRALRRQQLPQPHAGHGPVRPGRHARGAGRRPRRRGLPLAGAQLHQRLALPAGRVAPAGGRAGRRGAPGLLLQRAEQLRPRLLPARAQQGGLRGADPGLPGPAGPAGGRRPRGSPRRAARPGRRCPWDP